MREKGEILLIPTLKMGGGEHISSFLKGTGKI